MRCCLCFTSCFPFFFTPRDVCLSHPRFSTDLHHHTKETIVRPSPLSPLLSRVSSVCFWIAVPHTPVNLCARSDHQIRGRHRVRIGRRDPQGEKEEAHSFVGARRETRATTPQAAKDQPRYNLCPPQKPAELEGSVLSLPSLFSFPFVLM